MRTEDGRIIQECLNGKPEVFGLLVDKYKEGIYAFVLSEIRDFHDAQDVTQEVFLDAYRDLRSLRRWESFVFWLYRIARRRCALWFRIGSRRVDGEFIEDQDPKVVDAPSLASYRRDQLGESVREALDALPVAYREVLMLRYFGGMNSKEIAEALGVSPTAVRMRLSRARAQLREEMVGMMDTTLESQRLPTGFTFRIVEAVKHIKIHPMPRATGLPWGLSLTVGIIITVLSLNPPPGILQPGGSAIGSPLSSDLRVKKAGEIPVDVLEISEVLAISSRQGDGGGGDGESLSPQKALLMAPEGETTFSEVSAEAGISNEGHGYSATFVDYDNDGDLDIYVSNFGKFPKANKLYRNNGNGTFTDVAEEAGVASRSCSSTHAVLGDYNNDGYVDLYLVNGWNGPVNALYRNNGDGTFTDVTKEAGVGDARDGKVGVFWDYDNDSYLDIYATNYENEDSILYRGKGDGTFANVSGEVGSILPSSSVHSAAVGDYDNDGDLDLFSPNPYRNNGDGTFTSVSKETKIARVEVSGGVTLGDYNNDGHLDLYMTMWNANRLYKNNGDGTFTEVAQKAGVASSHQGYSAVFVDYDNDGYLDLYVIDNLLYQNNGDGTFTNVIKESGAESAAMDVWYNFCAALGDYDNDGDMDLYLTRTGDIFGDVGPSDELFRNNGNDNHWLHIKTVGTQSNRDGIGARVTVKAGNLSQIRDVVSEWGRSCPPVQFGMGRHHVADSVEIRWPSGQVTTLTDVLVDRMIEVTEGEAGYRVLHTGLAVEPSGKHPSIWGKVKVSKLYQNYPNPFNPETWIPFSLSEPKHVIIRIYTSTGQLIRTLDLGQKPSGAYLTKEKAAYWDGRNEDGEMAASDVYFYAMEAGEFMDLKKMVITR